MNRVCLVGRLTKETELRATPSGVFATSNTLAVNRNFKNQEGVYEADFINIVAWRNTAEYLCKYAKKGHRVAVEGKIQTRNYDNTNGEKVYITEVLVETVELLEPKKQETIEEPVQKPTPVQEEYNDPFSAYGETVQITDDFLD